MCPQPCIRKEPVQSLHDLETNILKEGRLQQVSLLSLFRKLRGDTRGFLHSVHRRLSTTSLFPRGMHSRHGRGAGHFVGQNCVRSTVRSIADSPSSRDLRFIVTFRYMGSFFLLRGTTQNARSASNPCKARL